MLIRLFAQRWLLEKDERGFHFAGGILRTATWWIFLIGFIYSIFKVKVPYIPTPKEDSHENYWLLSVPNILISLGCGLAIVYGLSIDWTPYSIAMASYAMINAAMLAFIVMMSQQKFLSDVQQKIDSISVLSFFNNLVKGAGIRFQQTAYGVFRNGPVAMIIGSSIIRHCHHQRKLEQARK